MNITRKQEMAMSKRAIWDFFIEEKIATKNELTLITTINGNTISTLNDVLLARTGCIDIQQFERKN